MSPLGDWDSLSGPAPEAVAAQGGEIRVGSRVRIAPRPGADIFDLVLAGRAAIVEAIEAGVDGGVTVAVVIEDDPGADLGFARQPGHRFFYAPDELVALPLAAAAPTRKAAPARVLVAGIGNVFLGDDGFGVALAERLGEQAIPPGVEVADFGIRGMDLAFAMQEGYDAVVLLDAVPRGGAPGTVYLIETGPDDVPDDLEVNAHGMDPLSVLGLVRTFGGAPPPTYVVGCEPATRMDPDADAIVAELSPPVSAALAPALSLLERVLADLTAHRSPTEVHR